VRSLSQVQKKMIVSAYDTLTAGGKLVYSTCTTTKEENEDVIEHLLTERPAARLFKARLDGLKVRPGLTEKTADCCRLMPQDNDCDPYFIAGVMKDG